MREALGQLDGDPDIDVHAVSSLYRTPPWGVTDQPCFFNAVARLITGLAPPKVLERLLALETRLGRVRLPGERWGPRVIDLDLLVQGETRSASATLELPHPRMHERAFVLIPLLELAPNFQIPGIGDARDCLARLEPEGIAPVAGPAWWRD